MYKEQLKEAGLTENEIKIYLALLRQGQLNPTQLAEKTGLHRSYVYDTLERLSEKGFVNSIVVEGKRNYQGANPNIIKEQFQLKLNNFESILPSLVNLYTGKNEGISIELYKGKRVYRTLIKSIVSNLKDNDLVQLIGIDESFLEKIEPIYLEQYFTIIKEITDMT